MLSQSERTLRARAAAYARHARTDGQTAIAPAHAGRWAKLLATVDPDGVLSEAERVRRAEALRKSQLALASLKSAKVRRERRERMSGEARDAA